MRVANGDGEGVCRVGASDHSAGEEDFEHCLNLRLFRAACANDRLLDQPRRIFRDRQTRPRGGEQADAARLPKLERRLRVGVDEHLFDRRRIGPVFEEDIGERAIQRHQPFGKRSLRVGCDLAIGDMAQPVALGPDDAPAGRAKAGIEAEDDQASFSIMSSGTS